MQRLSGTDALLLSMETPSWHGHVGGLVILDPTDAPAFGGFEGVRDLLARSLDRVPKYRMKLKEVPLHLDRPVWADDPHFDIGRHVRRIAVPPPGGAREMGELFGYLMSHQLDRRIPLWETWYVDGVAGGQVGIIAKYHHCLMDGVSGASLADQILDLEPNPPARAEPDVVWNPAVHGPSDLELFARSLLVTACAPLPRCRLHTAHDAPSSDDGVVPPRRRRAADAHAGHPVHGRARAPTGRRLRLRGARRREARS